jgi:virulence-associated protein VagC
MKTVSISEFRKNIKRYLDIAQEESVVIHRNKGTSFIIVPLEKENEDILLNESQKKAIEEAFISVSEGKVYSNEEAMSILKERHPKYFK